MGVLKTAMIGTNYMDVVHRQTHSFFCYWGKADPNYPGEPKWNPLVYHCPDVTWIGSQ